MFHLVYSELKEHKFDLGLGKKASVITGTPTPLDLPMTPSSPRNMPLGSFNSVNNVRLPEIPEDDNIPNIGANQARVDTKPRYSSIDVNVGRNS